MNADKISKDPPYLGHGVGLRVPHYEQVLKDVQRVDWFECISENFFGDGGRPQAVLRELSRTHPLVFHGVSMGIGSVDGVNEGYLSHLQTLSKRYQPRWVSDHLCWTNFDGKHSHDLLPLPYTEEALNLVCTNVAHVQERLAQPLVLENVSSYVSFTASSMTEWEFLNELCSRTGCGLLLDLNNVVVSAKNHGFKPHDFVSNINPNNVWQLHLANHDDHGHYKFDSHRGKVGVETWELYRYYLSRNGRVSTLVEWDEDVPPWEELVAEQKKAQQIESETLGASEGVI